MLGDLLVELASGVHPQLAHEAALGADHILDHGEREVTFLDDSELFSHLSMTTIPQLGSQWGSFTCLGHSDSAPDFLSRSEFCFFRTPFGRSGSLTHLIHCFGRVAEIPLMHCLLKPRSDRLHDGRLPRVHATG
jgi:hypothetical protein